MKVLVVSPYFHPSVGGLQMYVKRLAESLAVLPDVDVTVLTSRWPASVPAREVYDGIEVLRVPIRFRFSNTPLDPAWIFTMRKTVTSVGPDVIVVNVPVPGLSNAVAAVAGPIPVVVVLHAATTVKKGHTAFNAVARLYEATAGAWLLRRSTRIVAVSSFVAGTVPGRWRSKVVTVNNGVRVMDPDPQPRRRVPGRFVFLGQLDRTHAWKGLEQVLEACALCRSAGTSVELVVGGDGDDRARYEDMVRRLGLGDQVAFRGWVDADERRQLLASAMATVVYPTTANDALPTVICESWEAGTPVIVAAIGALPSIVTDGDAVVVEPSKPRLLAEALRALAEDTERAERMGKAGRARVEAEFNWENQVTQIERLLRGLAHNEHARERT